MAEKIVFCPFSDEWRHINTKPNDELLETPTGVQKLEAEKTKISLTK